jgi:2-polyprenyl-6-methoxyphenol hydroxylase-like FAD-dependent oxidoreductase
MATSTSPRIAIIGAGPAGLTLATLLLRQDPTTVTVFELDSDGKSRNQGGTLDLDPEDGQRALEACGLVNRFRELARPDGQARRQLDYTGQVLWDDNDDDMMKKFEQYYDKPEIDRQNLRDMLLDAVHAAAPHAVTWGKKLQAVNYDPSSNLSTLSFNDGSQSGPFDLVVGADGAWSKVRPLLTDVKPLYSGISMMELWARDVDNKTPWLAEFVGRGSNFMFDTGRAFMGQRAGEGNVRIYLAVRQPEDVFTSAEAEGTFANHETAKEWMLEKFFSDCGGDFKRAARECSDGLFVRPLYHLPVGHKWESKQGLTLVGDAAHLMTPFAGVGVNVGMRDGMELGERLVHVLQGKLSLEQAIKNYEQEMFPRAERFMKATAHGMEGHFSSWGNDERVKKMIEGNHKREAWLKRRGL